MEQPVASRGQLREVIGQSEAAQGFGDLSISANARQDFLADVAPFGVADGAGFDASLRGEIAFVHVSAEPRQGSLNPNHLQRLTTAHASACIAGGMEELFGGTGKLSGGNEQIKPNPLPSRVVHAIKLARSRVIRAREAEELIWQRQVEAGTENDAPRHRPLHP